MAPQLDGFFKQVDTSADDFIERLRKAVAIPSISAEDARRPDVVKMGEWLGEELKALGASVELRPLGKQPGKEMGIKHQEKLMASSDELTKLCKNKVGTFYQYHGGCVVRSVVDKDYRVYRVKRIEGN